MEIKYDIIKNNDRYYCKKSYGWFSFYVRNRLNLIDIPPVIVAFGLVLTVIGIVGFVINLTTSVSTIDENMKFYMFVILYDFIAFCCNIPDKKYRYDIKEWENYIKNEEKNKIYTNVKSFVFKKDGIDVYENGERI